MELYVDGGCSGNGQLDATKRRMIMVVAQADGQVVFEETESGGGSNNIAELLAVEAAYRWAASQRLTGITVYTDSQNNLSWANGKRPGRDINDRSRVVRIQERIAGLRMTVQPTLKWIPREQNVAGHIIERKYFL